MNIERTSHRDPRHGDGLFADPGPTHGDPLCLFTFRPKPDDRHAWVRC